MKFVFIFLLSFQLLACSQQPESLDKIHGYTMGTSYSAQWRHVASVDTQQAQSDINKILLMINQQMSTYQKDSELSIFNSADAPHEQKVSPELFEVLELSLSLHGLTSGYFDISVGPVVNLWGFGPDKMPTRLPSDEQTKQAQQQVGLEQVSLANLSVRKTEQRYLDLSAIAKGYGVDKVADYLESKGITHYLVEIGGEMRVKGRKSLENPWRVAVEKPDEGQRSVQKIIEMKTGAMATSGDYRNYFEMNGQQYSHSIDPFTAKPVKHTLASVTIIDETCVRADALATAMLVMGAEKAKAFAVEHKLKVYLIERGPNGFGEYTTPEFERWQAK
ncbi:FAD:protein FMN transferase [Pseudomonas sp. HK3]